jgi:NAD(P)-dependent dehydrogenase (short-subunit alcohol dehydrogenase family)
MLKQPPPPAKAIVTTELSASESDASASPAAAPALIDRLNYSIVNMSSSAGLAGMPEFGAYAASKFAMIGLTKTAAREYAGAGIRVRVTWGGGGGGGG